MKHRLATTVAPTLMSAGYWNSSGSGKTEVVANESISNRFCRAASVVENCERELEDTSCIKSVNTSNMTSIQHRYTYFLNKILYAQVKSP